MFRVLSPLVRPSLINPIVFPNPEQSSYSFFFDTWINLKIQYKTLFNTSYCLSSLTFCTIFDKGISSALQLHNPSVQKNGDSKSVWAETSNWKYVWLWSHHQSWSWNTSLSPLSLVTRVRFCMLDSLFFGYCFLCTGVCISTVWWIVPEEFLNLLGLCFFRKTGNGLLLLCYTMPLLWYVLSYYPFLCVDISLFAIVCFWKFHEVFVSLLVNLGLILDHFFEPNCLFIYVRCGYVWSDEYVLISVILYAKDIMLLKMVKCTMCWMLLWRRMVVCR